MRAYSGGRKVAFSIYRQQEVNQAEAHNAQVMLDKPHIAARRLFETGGLKVMVFNFASNNVQAKVSFT